MPTRHRMELGLYDARGQRKYLTTAERAAFLTAAEEAPREVRTLCGLLAHTGCRLSEALWLTADRESREMLGIMPPQASPQPQGLCPDTSA